MVDRWADDIKCARALIYFYLGQVGAVSLVTEADANAALEALKKTL